MGIYFPVHKMAQQEKKPMARKEKQSDHEHPDNEALARAAGTTADDQGESCLSEGHSSPPRPRATAAAAVGSPAVLDQTRRAMRRFCLWYVVSGIALLILLGYFSNAVLRHRLSGFAAQMEALQARIGVLEERPSQTAPTAVLAGMEPLQEQIDALREAVLGRFVEAPLAHRFAELDFLVAMADNQLQLNGDVAAALQYMQRASQVLGGFQDEIPDTALRKTLRRHIDADVQALLQAAGQMPDVHQLASYLGDLMGRIDTLPTMAAQAFVDVAAEQGTESSFLSQARQWLRGMVRIRQRGEMSTLLPADSSRFGTVLRLELASARLAVLRRDTLAFQSSIRLAIETLEGHFHLAAEPVVGVHEALSRMAVLQLRPEQDGLRVTRTTIRNALADGGHPQWPGHAP